MTKEEFNKVIRVVAKKIFEFDDLLDVAYSEQYSSEEILRMFDEKYFENFWNQFEDDVKKDPKHFGDCTGQPCPCLMCTYERYLEEAKEELEKEGVIYEDENNEEAKEG